MHRKNAEHFQTPFDSSSSYVLFYFFTVQKVHKKNEDQNA
jgi:hypothetical protein